MPFIGAQSFGMQNPVSLANPSSNRIAHDGIAQFLRSDKRRSRCPGTFLQALPVVFLYTLIVILMLIKA